MTDTAALQRWARGARARRLSRLDAPGRCSLVDCASSALEVRLGRNVQLRRLVRMFGLLFAVPLYFQVVHGTDAQGSGLRLLPLNGGMLVAGALADRLVARAGARVIAALGFASWRQDSRSGPQPASRAAISKRRWIALSGSGSGSCCRRRSTRPRRRLGREQRRLFRRLRRSHGRRRPRSGNPRRDHQLHLPRPARARRLRPLRVPLATARSRASRSPTPPVPNAARRRPRSFVSGMTLTFWVSAALMAAGGVLALVVRPRPSATHLTTERQEAPAELAEYLMSHPTIADRLDGRASPPERIERASLGDCCSDVLEGFRWDDVPARGDKRQTPR